MKLLLLLLFPAALAASADPSDFHAFCWAETPAGVYCTKIKRSLSYPTQGFACREFARTLGARHSGFFRDTDFHRIRMKLEDVCTYVERHPKWECFLETRCEENGQATSSLNPIGRFVFTPAGNSDAARRACVSVASKLYLEALKGATNSCLIGARAVMTVP